MYEMIPYTICYHRRKPSKMDSVQEVLVENICDLRRVTLEICMYGHVGVHVCAPHNRVPGHLTLCVAHALSGHEVIIHKTPSCCTKESA